MIRVVYIIIGVFVGLFFTYYATMTFESYKSNKEWYDTEFYNATIKEKITSINYFDVYPKRPVIGINQYMANTKSFSLSLYCEDNKELNNFIQVEDSVFKKEKSKTLIFIKKTGGKFIYQLNFCPDWI